MKKLILSSLSIFALLFMMVQSIEAQDQTEVTIQVKKDGKVVKDTTYRYDSDTDARHAVEMFEMISSEGEYEMDFNYTMAHDDGAHAKTMVFVSKDGEKTHIKEFHGDSLVWVSEEGDKDRPVKVMKYKVEKEGEDGEHVVVVSSSEGGTFDILIDEDIEGAPVKKEKRVKVVVKEDEDGTMHISEEELVESDEEVYVIKGDDVKKELKEVMKQVEDSDSDEVKVIVIKKGKKPEKKEKKNSE
jgi:hypothetical protein